MPRHRDKFMLALGTPYELLLALDTPLGAGNWLLNGPLNIARMLPLRGPKIDPTLRISLDGSYY